ncbi:hypothetical protein NMY22_g17476 [Coprinellus aureogranulatus]|nr:hypothetical protein NMY22_g17476 [Coprinellus aureogranulatus]
MNPPEGSRTKPKPKSSGTSRQTTYRAPTFFNSFADAEAREKEKDRQRLGTTTRRPDEAKRRGPPVNFADLLDPALKLSEAAASKASSSRSTSGMSVLKPPPFPTALSASAKQKASSKPRSSSSKPAYKVLQAPFFNARAGPSTSKAPAPPSQRDPSSFKLHTPLGLQATPKPQSSSSKTEYKVLPIPFYNPRAGSSTPKPPASASQVRPGSSSSTGWKPLGMPQYILPSSKKKGGDPEKQKNVKMVTPSTTSFALKNNPMTASGARALAALMVAHKAKTTEPPMKSTDRGMMMSPEKKDTKGKYKFVRGGFAARAYDYYTGANKDLTLWQKYMDYNKSSEGSHMQVRIVRLIKRPSKLRFQRDFRVRAGFSARRRPRPLAGAGRLGSVKKRPRKRIDKEKATRVKPPKTAIALCEVVSKEYPTTMLRRIMFVYRDNPRGDAFEMKDMDWREGAVVKVWRPWSSFKILSKPQEKAMLKSLTVPKKAKHPTRMDIGAPNPNSRKRQAPIDDDGMDAEIVAWGLPSSKRQRTGGGVKPEELRRQARPLPPLSHTQRSISDLKRLPVGPTAFVVRRFMFVTEEVPVRTKKR